MLNTPRHAGRRSAINPNAVCLVAFCAVVGALLGSVLAGLAIGLGLVVLASFL